jgi:hypothetical protein
MSNWAQQLEDDLKWREEELVSLKIQVALEKLGSVKHKALLRAMCAMLYAHYEGFCKFAWDLYLDELGKLNIKRKDCKEVISILSLEKKFKEMRGDLSPKSIWEFGKLHFHSLLEENLEFETKLETEANLWPNLFEDNVVKAGLCCTAINQCRTEIKALVARRNQIAHGKTMEIKDLKEYQQYEDAALLVMHDLAVAIVECLDKKLYLL